MENKELLTEEVTPMEEADRLDTEAFSEFAPQEDENALFDSRDSAAPEDTLTLRYKHEDIEVPKDEAKRLAQLGKHYEENVKDIIDGLDYFATLQGKSPKQFVQELIDGIDEAYRKELTEQLGRGNPLIEEMLELRRSKNQKIYERVMKDRYGQTLKSKLADQFDSISREFPEYRSVSDIPDEVLKRAMYSGDLEKEVLRFKLAEKNRVEAAAAQQEKNRTQSVGSVVTHDSETGTDSAFRRGLWS